MDFFGLIEAFQSVNIGNNKQIIEIGTKTRLTHKTTLISGFRNKFNPNICQLKLSRRSFVARISAYGALADSWVSVTSRYSNDFAINNQVSPTSSTLCRRSFHMRTNKICEIIFEQSKRIVQMVAVEEISHRTHTHTHTHKSNKHKNIYDNAFLLYL